MNRVRLNEAVNGQKAKAFNWGFAESKEKLTPYLWVDFVFTEIQGDNGEELTIRKEFYLTDNEKNFEHVMKSLSIMGWNGTSIYELDKEDPASFDLGKKEVSLTTEMVSYDGKMYARVKFINDPNFQPMKKIDETGIKKLNEKLRGKIAAYRAKNAEHEEIPF